MHPAQSEWIGRRVRMEASDHPHADESGEVVDTRPCQVCVECFEEPCGLDLGVRLPSGELTWVYEEEVSIV